MFIKKIFFIFFIFFLFCFDGKAESVEVVKKPSGILSTKTIRGKRIQAELNYIYINGEIAYCIEPGVALGSSYIKSEDFFSVGIGETLKKELELITYYGYEYEGHASPYYYAATQEYIWEKMGATDIVFTQNGNVIDVKPYKLEIFKLFIHHDTLPSFASKHFDMKVGETLKLQDTNAVLSHFTTSSSLVQIKDNTLFASSEKEGDYKIHFTQKKKPGKSLVYFSSTNQNVATFTLDDVYITVTAKQKRGNLIIQKLDKENGNPLKDATFYLYDEKGIARKGKTNKEGFVVFENLVYGKYQIKEEIAPKGYIKNDKTEEIILDDKEKRASIFNQKHDMPVTSNIDLVYKNIFRLFSSLGVFFFYVSKKII